MPTARRTVEIYRELAELEHQRGDAQMRDRFLILAADAALALGANDQAEQLRERLLEHNPHHLLRPYPTMAEALQSPDVASYVADLRRSFPPADAGRRLAEFLSDEVGSDEQARQVAALEEKEAPATEAPVFRFAEAPHETIAPPESPTPEVYPYPTEVAAHRLARREAEPDDAPAGAGVWLSSGLFGLLLLAGVALLLYTLARPFVPL